MMLASACGSSVEAALEGTRELSIAPCDPETGSFTLEIDND